MHSILLLFLCFLAGTHSYHLFAGELNADDVALYEKDVYMPPRAGGGIESAVTLDFPKPGGTSLGMINAIFVRDNVEDHTGGYPSITSGGVNQASVTIDLKSRRGYGLNYTVSIWGKPFRSSIP